MAPSIIPAIAIATAVLAVPGWMEPRQVHAGAPSRTVDLSAPGALDRIATERPAHYRRLVEVLDAASEISCKEMPGRLYVQFRATGNCTAPNLLLTSFPAKRRVAFTIDDTGYVANVVIRNDAGRLVPVDER